MENWKHKKEVCTCLCVWVGGLYLCLADVIQNEDVPVHMYACMYLLKQWAEVRIQQLLIKVAPHTNLPSAWDPRIRTAACHGQPPLHHTNTHYKFAFNRSAYTSSHSDHINNYFRMCNLLCQRCLYTFWPSLLTVESFPLLLFSSDGYERVLDHTWSPLPL